MTTVSEWATTSWTSRAMRARSRRRQLLDLRVAHRLDLRRQRLLAAQQHPDSHEMPRPPVK